MQRFISTAIPYVNASPHVGFALELVIADVLARHSRAVAPTYLLSGTDENSLKNVLAAERAGLDVATFVAQNAAAYHDLAGTLSAELSDFIRTSSDPRHAPRVDALWEACRAAGDIYQDRYEGRYCVGCEQFYKPDELVGDRCPDHRDPLETVSETNYFFALSRYQSQLVELIERDRLRIRPAFRRNEVLAFLRAPLRDISISRSTERAHGWGLPVPGDPSQVVYVWFDALANYLSAFGDERWSTAERITHVIGKGVTRFHAVYWPAILLSAGIRLPDEILIHGYVTVAGGKISKSLGNSIDPSLAARVLGVDALRYYLLRHVGSHRDGDFSWSRYVEVYEHELANQLGNLLSRTVALVERHGRSELAQSPLTNGLCDGVHAHIEGFALHRGLEQIWEAVDATNGWLSEREPWRLAKRGGHDEEVRDVLGVAFASLRDIGAALAPFLPETAARIATSLEDLARITLFPRPAESQVAVR